MLAAQLEVQAILEFAQCCVLSAGDGDGRSLVASGVHLNLVLEGVVVQIVLR